MVKPTSTSPRSWLEHHGYLADFSVGFRLVKKMGFMAVGVVRNPADRILSAYLNKFVTYRDRYLDEENKLESFAYGLYKKWCRHTGTAPLPYKGISFLEFLSFIEALGNKDPHYLELNPHFAPQYPSHLGPKPGFYDRLIKVDDPDSLAAELGNLFNRDYRIGISNKTEYAILDEAEDLSQVKPVDISAKKAAISKEAFLRPATLQLIKTIYRNDYLHFDYPL